MASTYSNLKFQLMATGENSGTWGNVTNVNLGTAIEQALVENADVDFTSGDVTLTLTDTNAAQNARALRLTTTNMGAAQDLIVPAIEKPYIINNTGSSYAVTAKVSGQTGVEVPAGKTMWVYNNGTDVVDAVTHLTSVTLASPLGVVSGGTGANTLTANSAVIGNGTSAVQFLAPGTASNVMTSDGTNWVSTYAFVPRSTTSSTAVVGDTGKAIVLSAGITIPASTFAAGAAISLYNDTAGDLTITQGAGLTMYLAGDGSTGNRTLATRGLMTIWFDSTTVCVCGGAGVS